MLACFPPRKLSGALFIMASRGQCENIEATDKQVGGWASPTTEKKKSNQCQGSHRTFQREGPLETALSRLFFYTWGKKETKRTGRSCLGHTASEEWPGTQTRPPAASVGLSPRLPVADVLGGGESLRLAPPLTPGPPLGLSPSIGCTNQMLTHHFSLPN